MRHRLVSDLLGEPNVGLGNGMARTVDAYTQAKLSRRIRQKNFRNSMRWDQGGVHINRGQHQGAILDLGCGDGVMLRAFQILGWKTIIGIEGDPELAQLALDNTAPKSWIGKRYQGNFRVSVYSEQFEQIGKVLNDLSNSGIFVEYVYAFNPCSPKELLEVIHRIRLHLPATKTLMVQLRNPVSHFELSMSKLFKASTVFTMENTVVLALESNSNGHASIDSKT
jgi:SAM-dependent methyltransferase